MVLVFLLGPEHNVRCFLTHDVDYSYVCLLRGDHVRKYTHGGGGYFLYIVRSAMFDLTLYVSIFPRVVPSYDCQLTKLCFTFLNRFVTVILSSFLNVSQCFFSSQCLKNITLSSFN